MKKYKITFFNPETLKKKVTRFTFCWDYINHCWDVIVVSALGESTRKYSGDPMSLVLHYNECKCENGEYVIIKNFA